MAITLKDVALLAGVSPSTVSRTCKDHPSISEETKEKVRAAMAELGYEPNFPATPTTDSIKTIGIILPPSIKEAYENSFYLEAIHGISSFCNQKHYMNTIITGNDEKEILSVIKTMVKSEQVDGFIVLYSKTEDPIIQYLFDEGLLYVLIGKAGQYANQTIYIDNDNLLAGKEATEYLIQKGHKKIAFIEKDSSLIYSTERKSGYLLALAEHGLPINPDYYLELPVLKKNLKEMFLRLVRTEEPPTAIVVGDDILAFALKHLCTEIGISIPEDLSIVSFNNSLIARMSYPELTSIDINSFQLGVEAASQVINHMENPNLVATKIIVPHQLIERQSCRDIL